VKLNVDIVLIINMKIGPATMIAVIGKNTEEHNTRTRLYSLAR